VGFHEELCPRQSSPPVTGQRRLTLEHHLPPTNCAPGPGHRVHQPVSRALFSACKAERTVILSAEPRPVRSRVKLS
jgi:hypothetical protein